MTADGRLTVLAPLAIEEAALRRALPGSLVVRTGMGPDRSRASAERLAAGESPWLLEDLGDRPRAVLRVAVDTPEHELGPNLETVSGGLTAYRSLRRGAAALADWAQAAGPRRVLLAAPRSFCAGVERAVDIVERALERYGPPVYVRKQIVHNVHVVHDLERRGARFVDDIGDIPEGAV